jgi:hypothetical protein
MTRKKDANGKKDRGLSNGEKRIQEIFEWKKIQRKRKDLNEKKIKLGWLVVHINNILYLEYFNVFLI